MEEVVVVVSAQGVRTQKAVSNIERLEEEGYEPGNNACSGGSVCRLTLLFSPPPPPPPAPPQVSHHQQEGPGASR